MPKAPLPKSASAKRAFKPPTSLSWRAVDLPAEVAAQANAAGRTTTDADFWLGLDAAADDFMGLQEVEGVGVRNEEGRVRFEVEDEAAVEQLGDEEEGDQEEEEEEVAKPSTSTSSTTTKKEKAKQKQKERKEKSKAAKFTSAAAAASTSKDSAAAATAAEEEEDDESLPALEKVDFSVLASEAVDAQDFDDALLPAWTSFPLLAPLKRALHVLGFTQPTSIQQATLPLSLEAGRDVVGIAQTGSGKTLAYGLPVLQWALERMEEEKMQGARDEAEEEEEEEEVRALAALILCPTRELALQVSKHLTQLVEAASSGAGAKERFASIATLTGGMSEEKQRRILHRGKGADVVVATPGRLWDMCQTDPTLTARIQRTRFLVVDEADRMIEAGHFAEMEHILGLVRRVEPSSAQLRKGKGKVSTGSKGKDKEGAPVSAFDDGDEVFAEAEASAAASAALPAQQGGAAHMQTLIFSATLSKELQQNLKRRRRVSHKRHKAGSTLEDLLERIDFRSEVPDVVDLTPERRVAKELKETKVECLMKEKDLYLYYFLLRYPGRTIVFINSIDGIRRLLPLLTNLGINAFPLHSQLQQKQRLKHLDRFRTAAIDASATAKGASKGMAAVLLATDVAARGLDVPGVDHVVHYQLPRSADAFVHRSGRTARAGRSGVSVALIEPGEKKLWRDLCFNLKRPDDIPSLPLEYSFLPDLRARLELSRTIDNAVHNAAKAAHEESWLKTLASEADLEVPSDLSDAGSDFDASSSAAAKGRKSNTKAGRKARAKLEKLRGELEELLRKPLSARGVSHKYLTSGSRAGFVQDLLEDAQHETLIGVKRSTAEDDLEDAAAPRKKSKIGTAAAAHAAATVPVAPAPVVETEKSKSKASGKKKKSQMIMQRKLAAGM